MKERPILFNTAMVRAILEGRKTQTRRIVKLPLQQNEYEPTLISFWTKEKGHLVEKMVGMENLWMLCPYGKPGDRLWVRETWCVHSKDAHIQSNCVYKADDPDQFIGCAKWIPSIHMPMWACRIMLEITSVRVERLNNISEEDAKAEGLKAITKDGKIVKYGIPDSDGLPGSDNHGWAWSLWNTDPIRAYRLLWESINGPDSWGLNPLVWVIEFKRAN